MRSILIGLILATWGVPAQAESPRLVVVLPFDFREAKLDDAAQTTLLESVRTIAGDILGRSGYTVLTGENTLAVLQDNAIDATKACDANCALTAARELKARLFISATVTSTEGVHLVFIRLYETDRGTVLASAQFSGAGVLDLRRKFHDQADSFFHRALVAQGSPIAEGETPINGRTPFEIQAETPQVVVRFDTTPTGAVVLVDGDLLCQETPCSKTLTVGTHDVMLQKERYEPVHRQVTAKRGASVSATLSPRFAIVSVETSPPGLEVLLDGRSLGHAPITGQELDAGAYELTTRDPCFEQAGERLAVTSGETKTIRLTASPRESALKVDATDSSGNALEADVVVDGQPLGRAPGTFKVPLCSKQVRVISGDRTWTHDLALTERQLSSIVATFDGAAAAGAVNLSLPAHRDAAAPPIAPITADSGRTRKILIWTGVGVVAAAAVTVAVVLLSRSTTPTATSHITWTP